jgi:F0F1-type ATP synthase membrane subunit c/vacuolar-type H+-ATPase subunit K
VRRYDPSVSSPAPPAHPNRPTRGLLALAFAGILVAGALGGAIGYGIVDTSCTETPTVGERLLESVPGFEATTHSCDLALVVGALAGAAIAGIGAGIVAGLMLRAQSEWRAHPPEAPAGGDGDGPDPFSSGESGESPRRT